MSIQITESEIIQSYLETMKKKLPVYGGALQLSGFVLTHDKGAIRNTWTVLEGVDGWHMFCQEGHDLSKKISGQGIISQRTFWKPFSEGLNLFLEALNNVKSA